MLGIKGFDKNLCIKGVQFKVGETYKYENWENEMYDNMVYAVFGFFDEVFNIFHFFPFNGLNRYCIVEVTGDTIKDSKEYRIVKEFKIVKELYGDQLFQHFATEHHKVFDEIVQYKSDGGHGCTIEGNFSCGVSKQSEVILKGRGYRTTMLNCGYSTRSYAIGDSSMAINRGNHSNAVSIGDNSVAYVDGIDSTAVCCGEDAIAIANGEQPMAMGMFKGSVLFLVERDCSGKIINHASVYVDGENIKTNKYYSLKNGKLIEL